jgi:hypothetical protein
MACVESDSRTQFDRETEQIHKIKSKTYLWLRTKWLLLPRMTWYSLVWWNLREVVGQVYSLTLTCYHISEFEMSLLSKMDVYSQGSEWLSPKSTDMKYWSTGGVTPFSPWNGPDEIVSQTSRIVAWIGLRYWDQSISLRTV